MFNCISGNFDFSPVALFPMKEDAAKDPRCVVVAEVIQQLAQKADMSDVTQKTLQDIANKRYTNLTQSGKISLPDADHRAFLLYQQGVSVETAQKYYSFMLNEGDAKRWQIIVV